MNLGNKTLIPFKDSNFFQQLESNSNAVIFLRFCDWSQTIQANIVLEKRENDKYIILCDTAWYCVQDKCLEIEISKNHVEELLDILKNHKIAIIPSTYEHKIFIDGYYIDMYLKFGSNYVCYSWHCEPNEEWNKLYRITEILLSYVWEEL